MWVMLHNDDNMASKCFREIHYPVTQKPDAGYKPSQTPEPLIGYVECHKQLVFYQLGCE